MGGERRGAESPEFNKSDLLVMICIFVSKMEISQTLVLLFPPTVLSEDRKCLTVSDTLKEAGSYQVRPELVRSSEATRTLTSFLSSPQHLVARLRWKVWFKPRVEF